ncbi:Scavenger receptor class F member 1 [Hondaea fermentalgiana]|uniref:Scavenger receptor class F member 1 n=1 Tax=Hondaea fermentalgiana TaxID=2315210 RepID=A0A2R5GVQ7_9STRA|nr:Scavenger receptor class F member 1 [Hondaea fermentalgiana]|eukprot:GBG34926.1 Scavenger receptor class F member 1 [Hondaea fermentalgiana]
MREILVLMATALMARGVAALEWTNNTQVMLGLEEMHRLGFRRMHASGDWLFVQGYGGESYPYGSVDVFKWSEDDSAFALHQRLAPRDSLPNDLHFGYKIEMRGDTLAVSNYYGHAGPIDETSESGCGLLEDVYFNGSFYSNLKAYLCDGYRKGGNVQIFELSEATGLWEFSQRIISPGGPRFNSVFGQDIALSEDDSLFVYGLRDPTDDGTLVRVGDDTVEHVLYRYERSGGEYVLVDSHAFMLEGERSLLPGLITSGPYVVITTGSKALTYVRSDAGEWSMVPETVDRTEETVRFYSNMFTMHATGRSATMFVPMSTYNSKEGMVAVYTRDADSDWQLESSIGPVRDDRADGQTYFGELFASLDKDTVFVTERTDDSPLTYARMPLILARGAGGWAEVPGPSDSAWSVSPAPSSGIRVVSSLAISSRGAFVGQSSAAVDGAADAGAVVGVLTAPPRACPGGDRSLCVAGEICLNEESPVCAAVACSAHLDCSGSVFPGRMPLCVGGFCDDSVEGSCSTESRCASEATWRDALSVSLGTVEQRAASRAVARRLVEESVSRIADGQDATSVTLRGLESATLDAALLDAAGGAEALAEILRELVCGGACELSVEESSGRRLAETGLINVRLTYLLSPEEFEALENQTAFGDGAAFEQALAAALNVTVEEVTVRASDGEVVVEYAVTAEAGAEGDPLTEEKMEALGRVRALVDAATDAVESELSVELGDAAVDYCNGRTCSGRGTCDAETGICACSSDEYWGVNCETAVSCNDGAKADGAAYLTVGGSVRKRPMCAMNAATPCALAPEDVEWLTAYLRDEQTCNVAAMGERPGLSEAERAAIALALAETAKNLAAFRANGSKLESLVVLLRLWVGLIVLRGKYCIHGPERSCILEATGEALSLQPVRATADVAKMLREYLAAGDVTPSDIEAFLMDVPCKQEVAIDFATSSVFMDTLMQFVRRGDAGALDLLSAMEIALDRTDHSVVRFFREAHFAPDVGRDCPCQETPWLVSLSGLLSTVAWRKLTIDLALSQAIAANLFGAVHVACEDLDALHHDSPASRAAAAATDALMRLVSFVPDALRCEDEDHVVSMAVVASSIQACNTALCLAMISNIGAGSDHWTLSVLLDAHDQGILRAAVMHGNRETLVMLHSFIASERAKTMGKEYEWKDDFEFLFGNLTERTTMMGQYITHATDNWLFASRQSPGSLPNQKYLEIFKWDDEQSTFSLHQTLFPENYFVGESFGKEIKVVNDEILILSEGSGNGGHYGDENELGCRTIENVTRNDIYNTYTGVTTIENCATKCSCTDGVCVRSDTMGYQYLPESNTCHCINYNGYITGESSERRIDYYCNGKPHAGAVRVFELSSVTGLWEFAYRIDSPDGTWGKGGFGNSIDLDENGDLFVVGKIPTDLNSIYLRNLVGEMKVIIARYRLDAQGRYQLLHSTTLDSANSINYASVADPYIAARNGVLVLNSRSSFIHTYKYTDAGFGSPEVFDIYSNTPSFVATRIQMLDSGMLCAARDSINSSRGTFFCLVRSSDDTTWELDPNWTIAPDSSSTLKTLGTFFELTSDGSYLAITVKDTDAAASVDMVQTFAVHLYRRNNDAWELQRALDGTTRASQTDITQEGVSWYLAQKTSVSSRGFFAADMYQDAPSGPSNTIAGAIVWLPTNSATRCANGNVTACGKGKICGYDAEGDAAAAECVSAPSCSEHMDCKEHIFPGRLPYCNQGKCDDKLGASSCSTAKTCNAQAEYRSTMKKSVGSITQRLASGGDLAASRAVANAVAQRADALLVAATGETKTNTTLLLRGIETAKLDSAVVEALSGNETALAEAVRQIVCGAAADSCEIEVGASGGRRLQEDEVGVISVTVSYELSPEDFEAISSSNTTFSDGSAFEQALATQLGVSTDDIQVRAVDGELEIEYVVVPEAGADGDPVQADNTAALQAVAAQISAANSAIATELGIDETDLGSPDIDYCAGRTCNDRGTCDPETGVCACSTDEYWGVNCETAVSCNGGTKAAGAAYCECPFPLYGLRCEHSVECGTCEA